MKQRVTILMLLAAAAVMTMPAIVAASEVTTQSAAESPETNALEQKRIRQSDSDDTADGWLPWLQMLLALAIVVGLIFGLQWALKRLAGGRAAVGGSDMLQIVARTGVTTKQELMLVRMGTRLVLIGRGPGGMTRLGEIDAPTDADCLQASMTPPAMDAEGGQS